MELDFFNIQLNKKDVKLLNPLVLAYIGDAVYELIIRTYIVRNNMDMNVHKLHLKVVEYVKAKAQSDYIKQILNELNEEEMAIFKRGRNSKSCTMPKHADATDYRMATGFEALIGYLYLINEIDRLNDLIEMIIK